MKRFLPLIAAGIALVLLIWLFREVQQFDRSAQPAAGYAEGGMGDISIRFGKSEIISRSAGVRQWRVVADKIELKRYPGGGLDQFRTAEFDGIHDGIFYRKGKTEAFFRANNATFDQAQQRFDIRGKIRVTTTKTDTLAAEDCIWSDRDDFVRFPSGARGKFGKNTVSAPMLLYQPKKRIVQCPQGATGELGGYRVQATILNWDLDRQVVEMPGLVSGERKGIRFTVQSGALDLKRHLLTGNNGHAALSIKGDTPELDTLR
jgi:hypothetical protein